ncbi:MAG: hypothetical protein QM785_14915 [Pyrinomonadaceae bacterium]
MTLYEDQEMILKDVTERFDRLKIPYMLTGSMALSKYAMMRMTNDIDIVMQLKYTDAQRIIDAFEPEYYVPHGRVSRAIETNFMFNLLHQRSLVKVDCVMLKNTKFQTTAFANRYEVDFSGFDVWIIGKEDLVLSKLLWANESRSEMQMRDVASIIRNGYDEEYVSSWAKKLGVENILSECITMLDNYAE